MGMVVTVTRGQAEIYAGRIDQQSHRKLATLRAGQSQRLSRLYADEVVSVQGSTAFEYTISLHLKPAQPLRPPSACGTAATCDIVPSKTAYWHCDTGSCLGDAWVGQVVSWDPWAAHASNNRIGNNSRTVRSDDGSILYPYMGPWADGCLVTALAGTVLIIEWQRGSESWRETVLEPGETHTIDFTGAEDSAMIESPGIAPFTVALGDCTPQPLPGRLPGT
jgi:hypothetical protein